MNITQSQEQSRASGSGSNSTGGEINVVRTVAGVQCFCGKEAQIRQSWTDANPGRRFYKCGDRWKSSCDYFRWWDLEKPYGWQKAALLEARDLIRSQAEELKQLREVSDGERGEDNEDRGREATDVVEKLVKENEILRVTNCSDTARAVPSTPGCYYYFLHRFRMWRGRHLPCDEVSVCSRVRNILQNKM